MLVGRQCGYEVCVPVDASLRLAGEEDDDDDDDVLIWCRFSGKFQAIFGQREGERWFWAFCKNGTGIVNEFPIQRMEMNKASRFLLHWTWCLKVEERKGWYRFFFQIH